MYDRGYYGQPYAQYAHYNHPYAYLGQEAPTTPAGPPVVTPQPIVAPPLHEVEHHHRIKVKPAAVRLTTGGFFQVALAVTVGLIGAGVVAGAAGAAAYKVAVRRGARVDIGNDF
jgi:hypothetical protein